MSHPFTPDEQQRLREDAELVRRASDGEPRAVDEFAEHLRQVPRFLSRIMHRYRHNLQPQDREDLAQEVCKNILERMPRFAGRSSLDAWIYRFCEYTLLNHVRRLRHRPQELDFEVPEQTPESDHEAEFVDRVHAALEALGGTEAEVIRLREREGLNFAEIAARLGRKPAAVKSLFHRGLEQIRARVGGIRRQTQKSPRSEERSPQGEGIHEHES